MDEIAKNQTIVVTPVIDVIEEDSFEFNAFGDRSASAPVSYGSFSLEELTFDWKVLDDAEKQKKQPIPGGPIR